MTKVGEEANFMKVQTYEKYNLNDQEQLKTLSNRGEGIIKNKKGTT